MRALSLGNKAARKSLKPLFPEHPLSELIVVCSGELRCIQFCRTLREHIMSQNCRTIPELHCEARNQIGSNMHATGMSKGGGICIPTQDVMKLARGANGISPNGRHYDRRGTVVKSLVSRLTSFYLHFKSASPFLSTNPELLIDTEPAIDLPFVKYL
jgi:hypothetical protein